MGTNTTTPLQNMKDEIHNLLQSREFGSLEEMQDALDGYSAQANRAPSEDFHGLSADQMFHFLHYPFDSPELIQFPEQLATEAESQAALLFSLLIERIGEKGTKLTATGNLGRKLCRDIGQHYFERYPDRRFNRSALKISSETNVEPLHTIRLAAQTSGLLRKGKGRMHLTKKCTNALEKGGMKVLYPLLFKGYCREFNWACRDGYDDLHIIQQSFPFLLYLLHKYGKTWRAAEFYSDIFLNAFPMALEEISPSPYWETEDTLENCFILRSLERFAHFFGLVELEQISTDPLKEKFRIRAGTLFYEMVRVRC